VQACTKYQDKQLDLYAQEQIDEAWNNHCLRLNDPAYSEKDWDDSLNEVIKLSSGLRLG
jgi:hypothetical protein